MVKILAICGCLMTLAITAVAQVSIGFSPIYSTQVTQNAYLNNTFENKSIAYELEAGLVSAATMRAYHLCNKEYNASVSVFDEKEKKALPANFKYCFCASRLEIGIPIHFQGFLIEPFFVDSYTKNCNTVTGDKINYTETLTNNTPGLGLYYSQLLYKGNNISAKGFYTPKDNLLEFRYNRFNNRNSIGLGYTYRIYDNIKISGPSLNLLLTF